MPFETDPDRLLARFLKYGRLTAVAAARRALSEAGVETLDNRFDRQHLHRLPLSGDSPRISRKIWAQDVDSILDLMGWGARGRFRILSRCQHAGPKRGRSDHERCRGNLPPPFSPVMSRNWW